MNKNKEITEKEYSTYINERSFLTNAKFQGSISFAKAILTLSAGALGFSVNFVKQVFPYIEPYSKKYILIAWIGFGMSAILILISYLLSQYAASEGIKVLEAYYYDSNEIKNKYNVWIRFLNIMSILSFLIGAASLIYFSFIDL